jgi:hypothetical protein
MLEEPRRCSQRSSTTILLHRPRAGGGVGGVRNLSIIRRSSRRNRYVADDRYRNGERTELGGGVGNWGDKNKGSIGQT